MIQKVTLPILILVFAMLGSETNASLISDIQNRIDTKTKEIKQLELEISKYQKDLNIVSNEAESLQKEIKTLDLTKKKIETDIKITEANIYNTSLTIDDLSKNIKSKEQQIEEKNKAIVRAVNDIRFQDDISVAERLLSRDNLSDYIETTANFVEKLNTQVKELATLKSDFVSKKEVATAKKKELSTLNAKLSGQKQSVIQTQKQKDNLLSATKNKESEYKRILAEKNALMQQFESDLFKYQSELKIAIDPSKYPEAKHSVLSWPLDNIYITQLFGKTIAAARLYTSGSHNGVDFRASDGTPVKAVLEGQVTHTGNTDLTKGCYSYGKWVLVKHPNGLSSVYGHLSSITVDPGQTVSTGEVIGYSGRTGYVTGPHLHLSVLASEGVRVMAIPNEKTVNCRGVIIPLADTKAFLDPMLYLPKI